MDAIKSLVEKIRISSDKESQIKILQEINKLFLTQYMLKIDDDFVLYPIEVEAYYYQENNFPDTCVHKYQWQQNRFGKLYFHRAGNKVDASFLYDGGGIDVCLSDSDDFWLGILIRGAWINQEETPVCTPGVLTRRVVFHICDDNSIVKIADKEIVVVEKLEENNQIVQLATNDKRNKDSILFQSTRFGISPDNHPEYALYKLRSLIELSEPNHSFKAKEKVVLDYMRDNKIEPIADNVRKILGSNSNSILEKLKSEN